MASKLIEGERKESGSSKSALDLCEDNPALAITARFRKEKILDAELLAYQRAKLESMAIEIKKLKEQAELSIQKAKDQAEALVEKSEEVKRATDKFSKLRLTKAFLPFKSIL